MRIQKVSDEVARCVISAFQSLPPKTKPRQLANGCSEWVPLAGIVLSRGHDPAVLECVALATGMKCLPHTKLHNASGNVVHDWHAEVLALRAFNRFLVDECSKLASSEQQSHRSWVRRRSPAFTDLARSESTQERRSRSDSGNEETVWHGQPFAMQHDVKIYMYCSEAPCGDASMELTMAKQEDATPWARNTAPGSTAHTDEDQLLLGRGNFDQLGIVRRKPSRPDAPLTRSKSCSDKLALKQCTGLLSGLTSLLICPEYAYIDTLILPASQCVPQAVQRAFGAEGRMSYVADSDDIRQNWRASGYDFHPFAVDTTEVEFEFSQRTIDSKSPEHGPGAGLQTVKRVVASNISALWTPDRAEVLINGVLQGRRQSDPKGASCVSRRKLWQSVIDALNMSSCQEILSELQHCRDFGALKGCRLLQSREKVKRDSRRLALKGWIKNSGDEDWMLRL